MVVVDATVVVVGATVVVVATVVVGDGATVVDVVGIVVGETVVVGAGSVVVVVVVDGGTTDPFPQQLLEAFQCFQPPFEYSNQAATTVLAVGS